LPFFRRRPKPAPTALAEPGPEALTEEALDTPVVEAAASEAAPAEEPVPEALRIAEEKTEQALTRTRRSWFGRITGILDRPHIDEDLWLELEEVMLGADVGLKTTEKILDQVRRRVEKERVRDAHDVRRLLKEEMTDILTAVPLKGALWGEDGGEPPRPGVILVVGVNGTGKTTTIAKLAHLYKSEGAGVVLAAGDTFRAAAIDQLKHWGERVGATVIAHKEGADPGAVAFDAIGAAQNRNAEVAIIDTAGRLHTKFNLMEELRKVRRVIERRDPTAPHEVLLVLDATTGQNALIQAKAFAEAVEVTAIALTKLDGTSKGGIVFAISEELGLPVRFVGTGEGEDDLQPFDAEAFVDALFE
jgi:fused signal recognition particle receptor